MDSYGQIDIYNHFFPVSSIDATDIHAPSHCMHMGTSYVVTYNNRSLPVMIGSDIHNHYFPHDNPLGIRGYYIVSGAFKSVNNIKLKLKYSFSKDRAYFIDKTYVEMKSMSEFYHVEKGKRKIWQLPTNWHDILQHSKNPDVLGIQLKYIKEMTTNKKKKYSPALKEPADIISLAYMLDCWYGFRDSPAEIYRLITSGEMIHDLIEREEDVLACFRTNTWKVKYLLDVYTVSEDMPMHNMIGNLESIRRVTYPTSRENMSVSDREVKDSDRGKICPVQTSDGALCGTVLYLATCAYLTTVDGYSEIEQVLLRNQQVTPQRPHHHHASSKSQSGITADVVVEDKLRNSFDPSSTTKITEELDKLLQQASISPSVPVFHTDMVYLYVNMTYKGPIPETVLSKFNDDDILYVARIDRLCFIFTNIGQIRIRSSSTTNNSPELTSFAASLVPYIRHNPPIRAMFVCSMIKQALSCTTNTTWFPKRLLHGEQPLIEPLMPVPLGNNILAGIMPWHGYNVEDAVVISESMARRFRSIKTVRYTILEDHLLDLYVSINDSVTPHMPLFRKYVPNSVQCVETVSSGLNSGTVAAIEYPVFSNSTDKYCVLTIQRERDLEVGDKLASRHGQKGVISLILPDSSMPRVQQLQHKYTGRHLDLLMNPHTFPSRMTMGHLREMENTGGGYLDIHGISNPIFCGEIYYMALRHQVEDKLQSRVDIGLLNEVALQPMKGRQVSGGLRIGQMERDVLIACNKWDVLHEFWSIDKVSIYVHPVTGFIIHSFQDGYIEHPCRQYFKICLAYIRALGYDILWWPDSNTYRFTTLIASLSSLPTTTSPFDFGLTEALDLRVYYYHSSATAADKSSVLILPLCLRSPLLNSLYTPSKLATPKYMTKIENEIKRLLYSKYGVYHTFVEGHRTNHCLRSVIVPDPSLDLYTVSVPSNTIPDKYGILNRQPSLNVTSLVYVNIVHNDTKCIHINPLLCKLFNADFDGDEMNVFGLTHLPTNDECINARPTQDYILSKYLGMTSLAQFTAYGITAGRSNFELMVKCGSKGKPHNLMHMYSSIVNSNECYYDGISVELWYQLCKDARKSATSISLNTPVTGYLASMCNNMLF